MIKREGKWHWTCRDCGRGARIPIDCDRKELVGKTVSCPGCGSVSTISPSLEVLSSLKTGKYLVTGRLDRSGGKYVMPDTKRLSEISERVAEIVSAHGGHVQEFRRDIRSVVAVLTQSAGYVLSKNPDVCAVLAVDK